MVAKVIAIAAVILAAIHLVAELESRRKARRADLQCRRIEEGLSQLAGVKIRRIGHEGEIRDRHSRNR